VSDIDTAAADSLKALDPKRPIREADIARRTPAQHGKARVHQGGYAQSYPCTALAAVISFEYVARPGREREHGGTHGITNYPGRDGRFDGLLDGGSRSGH
jgi:hypothetical protein